MFLRHGYGHGGARQVLLLRTVLCHISVPRQDSLATLLSRLKWTSSLGSGFDGSSFSDDEDNPYDEARKMHFGYGEPGSVTPRGQEIDLMVDEFNKVCFLLFLNPQLVTIVSYCRLIVSYRRLHRL
jgi:hypothetical protein